MTVLRVYDPSDCDAAGVPLGWERCEACGGTGRPAVTITAYGSTYSWTKADGVRVDPPPPVPERQVCGACDGHGSLKAAALAELGAGTTCPRCRGTGAIESSDSTDDSWWDCSACESTGWRDVREARCEDCGHPKGDATWQIVATDHDHAWHERAAEVVLRDGVEPALAGHYTPCDEGCRHGGPGRWGGAGLLWANCDLGANAEGDVERLVLDDRRDHGFTVEASWRPVDVRTLGWPHDLRPERLAVLCLRCWVNRDR